MSEPKKIFMIAGEASGDNLGGALIAALQRQNAALSFTGIGGPHMARQGLNSLMPMEELCVMGVWEVIWQLPRLIHLINGVVEEVEKAQPDVLITIDLPDFNFRVAQRLKKRGIYKGKIIHYVAPSVWAWRPGRAKKIAGFLDGVLCLFPFEPPYFEKHNLPAVYCGHPVIQNDRGDRAAFRAQFDIKDKETVLGLFFGSREAELKTHAPVFKAAVQFLKEQYPHLILVAPTPPHLEYQVRKTLEGIGVEALVIADPAKKWDAMAACDFAVAVSGTVGLELAYMDVPHVIAYKTSPVTAAVVKSMAKVKYVHLANILLDQAVVPEYLQGQCSPIEIAKACMRFLRDPQKGADQQAQFAVLREKLHEGINQSPSDTAAGFVLKQLT